MKFLPDDIREINLGPGDFHFGDACTRIRTVLGSCVAITAWHPELLIGGMCHYMLPNRPNSETISERGRYGDEAMQMMHEQILRANTTPSEYQLKIFGGARMFALGGTARSDIGRRNIEAAYKMAEKYGFEITAKQVGSSHMSLIFELWTGHVWCKSCPPLVPNS